jgi:uncharacterized membrane protein YvlD (DUF360 family)
VDPAPLRTHPIRLVVRWLVAAAALFAAAGLVPGVSVNGFWGALVAALLIAVINAALPPMLAALPIPLTLVITLLLTLVLDALMIQAASAIAPDALTVDSFTDALLAALVMSAIAVVLEVLLGMDDDDTYTLRVTRRMAARADDTVRTDVPGIVFLEIDGLALPVLQRAMRDGSAPTMAKWLASGDHQLAAWETDLSSQTGASQAGILFGSNDDIPAFRWVEKETGRVMTCSAPADCAEIERRISTGRGLLADGGASRGSLLSGDADHVILTVSRMDAEKGANPGYRAFFANGFNVTRLLVLFVWEVILEVSAALRARRRDVRPRGHRGGTYPLLRAAMCVAVRDLITYGVLSDLMRGRPAVYATYAAYDEVAHHSGLERADTLEALRKLDKQFARIERALPYAPRPYLLVVLSDHGQTQGATFLQRNGHTLEDLVERSLDGAAVARVEAGDENETAVSTALEEATGGTIGDSPEGGADAPDHPVVVMGSGNLGLIYLMSEPRRLTMEEIDQAHPRLLPALRAHPHVGWIMVRSEADGPVALGADGRHVLRTGTVEGTDPLAPFGPNAAAHLLRNDGFAHCPDVYVGSFYDPSLDEGCAFEELISFHGGIGGAQTHAFILHPAELTLPPEPLVGAASVYRTLLGWRHGLQGEPAPAGAALTA